MSKKIKNDKAEKAGLVCGIVLLACIAILAVAGTIKVMLWMFGF